MPEPPRSDQHPAGADDPKERRRGKDTDDPLEVERALHAAILRAAVDAIITIDQRGVILTINPAGERMFGYSAAELIGTNVRCLMPSPWRDDHDRYLSDYLRTGVKRIIGIGREVQGLRKSGSTFPVELAVSETRVRGEMIFTGIMRDVTPRKEAEDSLRHSEERSRSLIETAGIVIVCLSEGGKITVWNPEAERVSGYSSREALGRDFLSLLVPVRVREEVAAALLRVLDGYPMREVESPIECKSGSERLLLWNARRLPLRGSHQDGLVACGQDVTERRKLTEKFVEQQSLAKLGELSAMVAHEVKNPLAGIIGALRILEGRLEAGSAEREICEEMVSRTLSLNNSVNDILTYARPRPPDKRLVPLDILLEDTASLVSRDDRFGGLELDISTPELIVECDPDMLQPVILNLLLNSAQAMDGRGTISVHVRGATDEGGADVCTIEFRDSGPGIPPDLLEKVFEPFYTSKAAGTGLGLPIARRVIELHGGTIELDCPEGGGTRVLVRLPMPS